VKARMTLLTLLVLAAPLGAAEMDTARLRQLATLPTVRVMAGIGFSTRDGFTLNDRTTDPSIEIAHLRKELTGDSGDAERYLRLAKLYAKAERKQEANDAYDSDEFLDREKASAKLAN
jgi:hypothetical protein